MPHIAPNTGSKLKTGGKGGNAIGSEINFPAVKTTYLGSESCS
jgi:hypothetical protein